MKISLKKIIKIVAKEHRIDEDVARQIVNHGFKSLATTIVRGNDVRIRNVVTIYYDKERKIEKENQAWQKMKTKYLRYPGQ